MRRCSYCLQEKNDAAFNREHVIQQAFGVFDSNNFVLTCVCQACNHALGNSIDLSLSRDSLEAFDRYGVGLKAASEYKSLGKRSKTRVEFPDGPPAGADGYLIAPPDGDALGVTLKPRIGFGRAPDGPFEWAPLDRLPTTQELIAKGSDGG
jgi:hypothetical protein